MIKNSKPKVDYMLTFITFMDIKESSVMFVNKVFFIQVNWHRIKKSVHENRNHKCKSCENTFSYSGVMKRHINSVHNGLKDHKYDSCGKEFSQARDLKRHINSVHNGQKDHKCNSCEKSFSQAGTLKIHINAVHKDHKYASSGKAFSQARTLKKHIN